MTYVAYHFSDLKRFIEEQIRPRLENSNVALIAMDKFGTWRAPSKKRKYYSIGFAVDPNVFTIPDGALYHLMTAYAFAFFVVPAKLVKHDPITSKLTSMEEFLK